MTIMHDVVVPCEPALCLLQQQHAKEARQEREPQQSVWQLLVIICTRTGSAVTAAAGVSVSAEPGSGCGSCLPLSMHAATAQASRRTRSSCTRVIDGLIA